MSVENHMVADFYARLWPWIDHGQPMTVMLDDGGRGASATPDLCFHFAGARRAVRVEFKVLAKNGQIQPTAKQLSTWASATTGPDVWIAKVADAPSYLFWRHDDPVFLHAFRQRATKVADGMTRREVMPPNKNRLSLPSVFSRLLAYAETEHLLPTTATQPTPR